MVYVIKNPAGLYFTGTDWTSNKSDAVRYTWHAIPLDYLRWLARESKQHVTALAISTR